MGKNDDPNDVLAQIVSGKQNLPPSRGQVLGPQEGRIISVAEVAGTAVFVMKKFDDEVHRFGPAPYGRTDVPPEVGDRCLVVFVGGRLAWPWIVAYSAPS